jgi:hypothetical protein
MRKKIDKKSDEEIKKEFAKFREQLELSKKPLKSENEPEEGEDFEVSDNELQKNSDEEKPYNPYDDYETSMGLEKESSFEHLPFYRSGVYQCSFCNTIIEDKEFEKLSHDNWEKNKKSISYFMTDSFKEKISVHKNNHEKQEAIEYIKNNQPVKPKVIKLVFPDISLLELEKTKLVKFNDEVFGWTLTDFVSHKKNEINFDSLITINSKTKKTFLAPCINCEYEETCSVDSKNDGNPLTCDLLINWVNGTIPKVSAKTFTKKISPKNVDYYDEIDAALKFFGKSKKFNFQGKIGVEENSVSFQKFFVVDKVGKTIPVALEYYDEKNMKIKKGEFLNIKIKNAKLTGPTTSLIMLANLNAEISFYD